MNVRFNLPWDDFPCDGASSLPGVSTLRDPGEFEELLEAWARERHSSIELGLFLDQAFGLLRRLMAEGHVTPESRRRIKLLLSAFQESKDDDARS